MLIELETKFGTAQTALESEDVINAHVDIALFSST